MLSTMMPTSRLRQRDRHPIIVLPLFLCYCSSSLPSFWEQSLVSGIDPSKPIPSIDIQRTSCWKPNSARAPMETTQRDQSPRRLGLRSILNLYFHFRDHPSRLRPDNVHDLRFWGRRMFGFLSHHQTLDGSLSHRTHSPGTEARIHSPSGQTLDRKHLGNRNGRISIPRRCLDPGQTYSTT